jgi:hypothetical protein
VGRAERVVGEDRDRHLALGALRDALDHRFGFDVHRMRNIGGMREPQGDGCASRDYAWTKG